jgi:hypothetical protein
MLLRPRVGSCVVLVQRSEDCVLALDLVCSLGEQLPGGLLAEHRAFTAARLVSQGIGWMGTGSSLGIGQEIGRVGLCS